MGRNGPRYSTGALGFGSYVSRWLHPPRSQTRMRAVRSAVVGNGASARRRYSPGRDRVPNADRPNRRNSRREPAGMWLSRDLGSEQLGERLPVFQQMERAALAVGGGQVVDAE